MKETVLVGTAPYLLKMSRRMTGTELEAMRNNEDRLITATSFVDKNGKKMCNGGKDLKKTQQYPMGFGCLHALLYQEANQAMVDNPQRGFDFVEDTDSDSEIGEDAETCFDDFRYGPDHFKFPLPARG